MQRGIRVCAVLFAVMAFVAPYAAQAEPWAVVGNNAEATISTIDLGTTPPTLYGPFLAGELGTEGGGVFDIAVVPNSPYILVSNFGDSLLFRVDISDPTAPVAAGSIKTGFFAEDIAVAPNGKFALVTDGGFSYTVAVIDLDTFTLTTTSTLTAGSAQAVAIAADSQTAIFVDYFGRLIVFGTVDPATGIVSESSLPTDGRPVNVAISPDGQTALVANFSNTAPPSPTPEAPSPVNVYRITGPGTVVEGTTPTVDGLPGCQQSIAFSPDGGRAYVETSPWSPPGTPIPDDATTQLSWLDVTGPGEASLGAAAAANLLSKTSSAWFGVDTLAVSGDGKTALATNLSASEAASTAYVSAVDLSTWSVSAIGPVSTVPAGIAMLATPTPTPTPTPILAGVASSESPSVGGPFTFSAICHPLSTPFDAYGVVLSPTCGTQSFNPSDPTELRRGVLPLAAGVPGLSSTWEGLLFGQPALLPYTQGRTYTFILGLVPAGTPPSRENVIPGCYWEGQVTVK